MSTSVLGIATIAIAGGRENVRNTPPVDGTRSIGRHARWNGTPTSISETGGVGSRSPPALMQGQHGPRSSRAQANAEPARVRCVVPSRGLVLDRGSVTPAPRSTCNMPGSAEAQPRGLSRSSAGAGAAHDVVRQGTAARRVRRRRSAATFAHLKVTTRTHEAQHHAASC
jgi:hypothetical protein